MSCCCGQNSLSMSTSNPNASICQSVCCCDGGASNIASILNVAGKWGSVLTAQATGRAVSTKGGGVTVGAKGASGLPGQFSGMSLILILLVLGGLLYLASKG